MLEEVTDDCSESLRHRLSNAAQITQKNDKAPTAWQRSVAEKSNLLQWKDMPKHLQFNPYIFTGYRPLLSVWGCLNSLFYLHNETINILTHGKSALTNLF